MIDINAIKKGDIVYYKADIPETCLVVGLYKSKAGIDGVVVHYEDSYGINTIPPELLYLTKEDCKEAIDADIAEIRQGYMSEINSLEDLVKFLFTHTVAPCDEYTDWLANEVAKEKAVEFGITL